MWGIWLTAWVLGGGEGPGDRPPLPFLGDGGDGGLVLLSQLGTWYEWDEKAEGADDVTPEEANRRWLGGESEVVAVDPRRGFVVDAAPHTEVKAVAGARLEVVGAATRCEVEVVGGVRAMLWFSSQLSEMGEPGDEPLASAYRGPGLRVGRAEAKRAIGAQTELITAATLERDPMFAPVRWRAQRVKRVAGECPLEGVVGPVGQLVEVVGTPGGAALADALRKGFRANRWVKKLTAEYRKELAAHGASGVGCESGDDKKAPPRELDEGHFGLRTVVYAPEGASALALAYVGNPEAYCDPSNAAIVYRQDGARWRQVRELWGGAVKAVRPEVVVAERAAGRASGRVWLLGWWSVPGVVRGWDLVVTGLDKPGAGASWGDWPDPAAHFCNYGASIWEFSSMCVFEEPADGVNED